jgi:hypothetical protein
MSNLLLRVLSALAFALCTTSLHAETVPLSTPEPRASAAQVATLVSLQHRQYAVARDTDTSASQKACVSLNLSTVSTDNTPIDEREVRLDKLKPRINEDCAARIAKLRKSIPLFEAAARHSLEQAYSTQLSASNAQLLIDYYHGEEGKRYLRFQEIIAPFAAYGIVGPAERLGSTRRPTDDVLKARVKALRLASVYQSLELQHEEARRAGQDTSGFAAVGIMIISSAIGANATLDRIGVDFAEDLPAFEAFASSEPEKAEQRAILESAKLTMGIEMAQARTLDPSMNGNKVRWQQVYDSMAN